MFGKKLFLKHCLCPPNSIHNTNLSPRLLAVLIVIFLCMAGLVASPAEAETSPHVIPAQPIHPAVPTAAAFVPQTSTTGFPGASWQTATPQEVGMDPVKFSAAMSLLPSPSVVIRNGRIVGQKGDIARTGYIWSGSKSLIALIFARLLQQGRIANYDVVVPNNNVPSNHTATFRQFLSM